MLKVFITVKICIVKNIPLKLKCKMHITNNIIYSTYNVLMCHSFYTHHPYEFNRRTHTNTETTDCGKYWSSLVAFLRVLISYYDKEQPMNRYIKLRQKYN